MTIEADAIILAIGQETNAKNLGIRLEHGEAPSAGYRTRDPKVFITGDIAQGDKTVVYAVQKGKEVAGEIDSILGGNRHD